MTSSFELDPVERITAGAVGEPGSRTFYVQARSPGQLVTLQIEKEQVRALAVSIQQILEALPVEPAELPAEGDAGGELEEPLLPEWRVGPMSLQYDETRDRIVIEATELLEPEVEVEPSSARFVATRAQALAMAERAEEVVEAGRPRCRFCGSPMDPEGHVCTAMNGHHKSGD